MIERVERFQPLFRERGWERTLKVYEALREAVQDIAVVENGKTAMKEA